MDRFVMFFVAWLNSWPNMYDFLVAVEQDGPGLKLDSYFAS